MRHRLKILLFGACIAGAPMPASAQPHDWTGLYAGVTGVYAFADADSSNDYLGNAFVFYTSETRFEQGFAGARIGRNFHAGGGTMIGVEADLAFGGTSFATAPTLEQGVPYPTEDLFNISSVWSARMRLARPMGNLLPFVTGGIAGARLRTGWESVPRDLFYGRGSSTAIGYTLGAGLEYALTPNVRLHTEYRFTDFGTSHIRVREDDGFTTVFDIDLHTHAIVFGASWVFDSSR